MKKKAFLIALSLLLLAAVGTGAAVYARGSYGSRNDPLVTLSYLEEVFRPDLLSELADSVGGESGSSAEGTFLVVTLSRGQILEGQPGCEILPRLGSCTASGSDYPALVDTTSGGELSGGETLEKNHLYMVTIAGNGIRAAEDNTKILVSGSYAIYG